MEDFTLSFARSPFQNYSTLLFFALFSEENKHIDKNHADFEENEWVCSGQKQIFMQHFFAWNWSFNPAEDEAVKVIEVFEFSLRSPK